ncbi:E3 ubiquitin-protein ligase RING1 [Linum grandiflorum]
MSQIVIDSHLGEVDTHGKIRIGIIVPVSAASFVILAILGYKIKLFIRNRYRRRWLSKHLLPSLRQMSYREATELIASRFDASECSVCLEAFEEEEKTVTVVTGCNHIYCPNCIRDWLLKSTRLATFPSCPICKSTIPLSSSPT